MAAAKKSSSAKKTAATAKTARTRGAAKSAGKKTASKRVTATKSAGKKAASKRVTATKSAGKKTVAKKTTTKRTAAEKTATRKMAAEKTTATKTTAKRAATKKAPAAKKTTATKKATATKKSASKKTAAASRRTSATSAVASSILSNERPGRSELPKPRGTTKDGITYTKDFDVKFLKQQRDELVARREAELARATRLEDEATSLIEDGEMGDVQFDDEGGEGDTMVVQRDLDRVLSNQARQAIQDIDAALARIEAGTYGYSEVSGLPIPRERLEALPETTVLAAEKVSGIGR